MSLFEQAALSFQKGAKARKLAAIRERRDWWWTRGGAGRRDSYTERFLSSLIALISIFLRPMVVLFYDLDRGRKLVAAFARGGEETSGCGGVEHQEQEQAEESRR